MSAIIGYSDFPCPCPGTGAWFAMDVCDDTWIGLRYGCGHKRGKMGRRNKETLKVSSRRTVQAPYRTNRDPRLVFHLPVPSILRFGVQQPAMARVRCSGGTRVGVSCPWT